MSDIAKYKLTDGQKELISQSKWLTKRQRKIFNRYYKNGWKIEDIAAELRISRSTVWRDLDNIRMSLK